MDKQPKTIEPIVPPRGPSLPGAAASARATPINAQIVATTIASSTKPLKGQDTPPTTMAALKSSLLSSDQIVPAPGPGFAIAFALAALRPNADIWLGKERLGRVAQTLGIADDEAADALDDSPPLPAGLEDNNAVWIGRRVPIVQSGGVVWIDLFWRPIRAKSSVRDRTGAKNQIGVFAIKGHLDATGRIEIRGRLEQDRLDAVAETESHFPQATIADAVEAFEETVRRLGLTGSLTIRSAGKPQKGHPGAWMRNAAGVKPQKRRECAGGPV